MNTNGARRLRDVHPVRDEDGATWLLYDLERTMIFDVPVQWKRESLAKGDIGSKGFQEWLQENDVLTTAPPRKWSDPEDSPLPVLSDLSLDMSGACNMGCTYCFEKPINSRIGQMPEEIAFASLDFF